MADRFFVGDTDDDWDDPDNWAATSGGAGGAGVPTASDLAIFDVNSPSCGINVAAVCLSIDSTGYTNTLTQESTFTLTVGSGNFLWAAGTFTGGDSTIDINGTFALSGGTFTSTSATMFVLSTFTISGAPTFSANGGTIRVGESGNITFTANGETFFNLEFFKTAGVDNTVTLADNFTVSGTLTVDKTDTSDFDIIPSGTRTITLQGDFSFADASASDTILFGNSSLTLLVSGTGDQTFTKSGLDTRFNAAIDINKSSGNFILGTDFAFGGNFTRTAGTVNQAGFSIILGASADATITVNGLTFVDLEFKKTSGLDNTVTLADDFTVTGNLAVDKTDTSDFEIVPSGTRTITLEGNFSIANTAGGSDLLFGNINLTLLLSNTASQTLTRTGTGNNFNANLTVNKSSGTASLATAFVLNATGADLTVTSGNFDLDGFDITVNDLFTVTDTLTLKGNETLTFTTFTLDQTQSTVVWKGSAVTALVDGLAAAYFNLTYGASKTHNVTAGVGNGIEVKGTLASNGTAGTRSILRSTAGGTQWELNLSGTSILTNKVDVQDSNANAGNLVQAPGSIDNGNNDNWNFVAITLVALERHYPRGIVRGVARGVS